MCLHCENVADVQDIVSRLQTEYDNVRESISNLWKLHDTEELMHSTELNEAIHVMETEVCDHIHKVTLEMEELVMQRTRNLPKDHRQ
jgi:hypothetical protein